MFMAYITLLPLGDRKATFRKMFTHLYELNRPDYIIIETGTARSPTVNWSGDGMSTILFDFFILLFGGILISIDLSDEALHMAASHTSSHINYMCGDSVAILHQLKRHPQITRIDLLYLDSYDVDWENPHPSALHHMKELCAVQPLSSGCMVVIDDNRGDVGKGQYVSNYFAAIGIQPVFNQYQVGFVLP